MAKLVDCMTRLVAAFLFSIALYASAPCPPTEKPSHLLEVGAHLQTIEPNQLPEFGQSIPTYALSLGLEIWGPLAVYGRVNYGSVVNIYAFIAELGMRVRIATPFMDLFATLGGHHFKYGGSGSQYRYNGGAVGLGGSVLIAGNVAAELAIKTYLQERNLFSYGVGIVFLF